MSRPDFIVNPRSIEEMLLLMTSATKDHAVTKDMLDKWGLAIKSEGRGLKVYAPNRMVKRGALDIRHFQEGDDSNEWLWQHGPGISKLVKDYDAGKIKFSDFLLTIKEMS